MISQNEIDCTSFLVPPLSHTKNDLERILDAFDALPGKITYRFLAHEAVIRYRPDLVNQQIRFLRFFAWLLQLAGWNPQWEAITLLIAVHLRCARNDDRRRMPGFVQDICLDHQARALPFAWLCREGLRRQVDHPNLSARDFRQCHLLQLPRIPD